MNEKPSPLSTMNGDSDILDYLTVDSINWASGEDRPKLTLEDKRAKHRVHQRRFMLRQRERLDQLRRDLRCYKLQLVCLQAAQEAAILESENALLRHQALMGDSNADPESESFIVHPYTTETGNCSERADDSVIFDFLAMLPEFQTTDVEFDHMWSLPCSKHHDPPPHTRSPMAPCEVPVWSVSPEF